MHCDPDLSLQLKQAAHSALRKMSGGIEDEIPQLMSGAGHDAMAMSHLTKVFYFDKFESIVLFFLPPFDRMLVKQQVAMLFVRCRGGVSHSPKEFVLDKDVWAAGMALLQFLETM